jgi:ABC-type lipoprotein export system ATPase subunit
VSMFELRAASKTLKRRGRTVVVLEDASMSIDPGELAAVWGLRGSGRTTLLRLAAGVDTPDKGRVLFDGRDLAVHGDEILGRDIGYCQQAFPAAQGQSATDAILLGMLVRGVGRAAAIARAHEVLERVDASTLAQRRVSELNPAECTRLAIAHVLALDPRLLIVDDPVAGVDLHERDDVLLLLRALADEGIAVLMTVGDPTGLTGADQSLTIGDGELHGSTKRQLEPVVDLDLRRRSSG